MKHLSSEDIEHMLDTEFQPNDAVSRQVRSELHLRQRIPDAPAPRPECVVLDLHMRTEEQAWNAILQIATSGVRHAKIITGASGILKIKFQQWARDSLLSPYVISVTPINNGSFDVKFRKQ